MTGDATARQPAGDLLLVRDFVNTLDLESGEDSLSAEWLADRGLGGDGAADLRRARELREALRSLLVANNGGGAAGAAAEVLDAAARRARLEVRFDPAARAAPAASGLDGALGRLLAIVAAAMADGRFARLKACRAEGCRWAFYDGARNRSRTWCSMRACGNREKARAYRKRRARPD